MLGFVTSSTTRMRVDVPLPKRIPDNLTATLEAFSAKIRTTQGKYLDASSDTIIDWTNGYTASVRKNSVNKDEAIVTVDKSSAFANVTNNTPVVVNLLKIKITFS